MPRVKRAVIVIASVVVLALGGLLIGYGTVVYRLYRKPDHSIGLSDSSRQGVSFFEDLRLGRRAIAYQSMSTMYRSRLSQSQFETFLDEYPLLNSHTFVRQGEVFGSADGPDQPLNAVRISYTLMPVRMPTGDNPEDETKNDPRTNRRRLDLKLHFVEENGKWVVDQITFP